MTRDKEKKRAYNAEYYAAHKEQARASQAKYRAAHREQQRAGARAYYAAHPEQCRAYRAKYDASHKEQKREYNAAHRDHNRQARLKREYGITPADFDRLLAAQNGCCAICGTDKPGGMGRFHVDHDHATGRVRGILCHGCNTVLGHSRDDPRVLLAATAYLLKRGHPV
jgi:ferric-dicitrate binding protein FerR (iron transport regulator)